MPNRLMHETSPYLLQHADNPVDWYPWGEAALHRARDEDKPILLSVGYSACHWCHVMAHESFEDAEVAAVMNALFVNVKVDREERPDIDQIYQTAHQVLAGRPGGWPLTMFLAPDGMPFFGGTYFPKTPRFGLPGFPDLLRRVDRAYRDQREQIGRQNEEVLRILAGTVPAPVAGAWAADEQPITDARRALLRLMDPVHGGIGQAPKFPHPYELAFLLREAVQAGEAGREAVLLTLTKMADGGLYDHAGGGFCRYSTDGEWQIPHFEKMLYDNAPLLGLYTDAWTLTRDPRYERVCRETVAWLLREMQLPSGGFASSLDADSEGEEGKFYVWTPDEVAAVLPPDTYRVVASRFGLDAEPNFEDRHWHLHVARSWAEVSRATAMPEAACRALCDAGLQALLAARAARIRPGRDDKILTSWNALAIGYLARAARVFREPGWLAAARRACAFLRSELLRGSRLLATHKDGRSHLNAYLDDYAFLIAALLELMEADFDPADLAWAVGLADAMLEAFEDTAAGGFWFTSHDHETLILRSKPAQDHGTPSGNGIAAMALQRLGHLCGEPRYLRAAERTLSLHLAGAGENVSGMPSLLTALRESLVPPTVVIVRGHGEDAAAWGRDLDAAYRPGSLVVRLPEAVPGLPAALDKPAHSNVNAWICRGVTCLPPTGSVAEVLAAVAFA